ncbi:MAG: universal stress protein [Chloroflexi bacterium]|nr:universal stress protein [Chloroflexota bacterium]
MYRRILVPLDGSRFAERALDEAKRFVGDETEIILLEVVHIPFPVMTPDLGASMVMMDLDEMLAEAQAYLNGLVETLKEEGVRASAEALENENVAVAIVEYAREHDIDLIVMSTHGRGGLSRLVFGSVAEGVLRQAPCPVLLVRATED